QAAVRAGPAAGLRGGEEGVELGFEAGVAAVEGGEARAVVGCGEGGVPGVGLDEVAAPRGRVVAFRRELAAAVAVAALEEADLRVEVVDVVLRALPEIGRVVGVHPAPRPVAFP